MNSLHSNGSLVLFGRDVVHTGGHWVSGHYWDEMESYNEDEDVWTHLGPLPYLWLYHRCASVYLTK